MNLNLSISARFVIFSLAMLLVLAVATSARAQIRGLNFSPINAPVSLQPRGEFEVLMRQSANNGAPSRSNDAESRLPGTIADRLNDVAAYRQIAPGARTSDIQDLVLHLAPVSMTIVNLEGVFNAPTALDASKAAFDEVLDRPMWTAPEPAAAISKRFGESGRSSGQSPFVSLP